MSDPAYDAYPPPDELAARWRTLSGRLRWARAHRQWNELPAMGACGVDYDTLTAWETGTAEPTPGQVLALARCYGLSRVFLLWGETRPIPKDIGAALDDLTDPRRAQRVYCVIATDQRDPSESARRMLRLRGW